MNSKINIIETRRKICNNLFEKIIPHRILFSSRLKVERKFLQRGKIWSKSIQILWNRATLSRSSFEIIFRDDFVGRASFLSFHREEIKGDQEFLGWTSDILKYSRYDVDFERFLRKIIFIKCWPVVRSKNKIICSILILKILKWINGSRVENCNGNF